MPILLGFVRCLKMIMEVIKSHYKVIQFTIATARQFNYKLPQKNTFNSILIALFF